MPKRVATDIVCAALATATGGAIDAWVYLAHGHVFAVAQSGNVALMGIELANGRIGAAAAHLPSLVAFIIGLAATRAAFNASAITPRLAVVTECVLLFVLGIASAWLPQAAITAAIGFIAGIQMVALSTFGEWNVQSAVITGDLRQAVDAVLADKGDRAGRQRGFTIMLLCSTFVIGAGCSAWLTQRIGNLTLLLAAAILLPVAFIIEES